MFGWSSRSTERLKSELLGMGQLWKALKSERLDFRGLLYMVGHPKLVT